MSRLAVIYLTALLVLSIISAGHAEVKAVFGQRPSGTVVAPLSLSHSMPSGILDANSLPTDLDVMFGPLSDRGQGARWIGITDYQRQIDRIGRAGYRGAQPGATNAYKFGQHEQSKLPVPMSLSASLCSLSPPGLILRL